MRCKGIGYILAHMLRRVLDISPETGVRLMHCKGTGYMPADTLRRIPDIY